MVKAFLILKNDRYFRLASPFLQQHGIQITGISDNPFDIAVQLSKVQPDVVIVDANRFFGTSGTRQLVSNLRRDNPGINIILVTTVFDQRAEAIAMSCGARGYFCRDQHIDEIVECIQEVAAGNLHFRSAIPTELLAIG